MHRTAAVALTLVIVAATYALPVSAADPVLSCANKQQKAIGKYFQSKLKCKWNAHTKPGFKDGKCHDKAEAQVITAFAKSIAAGGCLFVGNPFAGPGSIAEGAVDDYFVASGSESSVPDQYSCAKKRLTAASKFVRARLTCLYKAMSEDITVCGEKAYVSLMAALLTARVGHCPTSQTDDDLRFILYAGVSDAFEDIINP
jgi:hypothetical protein